MSDDARRVESTPRIIGMRDAFFERLFELFKADERCFFITADNGAPTMDRFAQELPERFATVGIAEQQMLGMAAGLAIEGFKVYCYAIAPFVTTRVHEQVKLDLCAHDLDVCLVGVGAGYAYDVMGPSHHTIEDISILRVYRSMHIWSPPDTPTARALADLTHARHGPQYVRLDRTGLPDLPSARLASSPDGVRVFGLESGTNVCVVSTGAMTHVALDVAKRLGDRGLSTRVVDVFAVGPDVESALLDVTAKAGKIVTLEEHVLAGGFGSWVLEVLNDADRLQSVVRLGVPGTFTFDYGGREAIREKYELTAAQVTERIVERLGAGP